MNNVRDKVLLLHASTGMTRSLLRNIMRYDRDLEHFFRLSPYKISEIFSIKSTRASQLHSFIHDNSIRKKLDSYKQKYTVLTKQDTGYPTLLRTIPDPPIVLYLQGDPHLLESPKLLSVIGTRTPSDDAFPAMKSILNPVIKKGYVLVSGLAKGIDQYAHQLALESQGKTIAVIGSGFHHLYPKNDMEMLRTLADNHLMISEYPPDTPPKKYHFPERNRIISGITPATFVVEARVKSGTQITVDQALEQGRDVFAMPGRPGSDLSEGCHRMINDGAVLVHDANDILERVQYREIH